MTTLKRHNDQVNRCRRYMASAVEFGEPPHPSHLRRRCRSDGWGKRGRGVPGWRASRIRCERMSAVWWRNRRRSRAVLYGIDRPMPACLRLLIAQEQRTAP